MDTIAYGHYHYSTLRHMDTTVDRRYYYSILQHTTPPPKNIDLWLVLSFHRFFYTRNFLQTSISIKLGYHLLNEIIGFTFGCLKV